MKPRENENQNQKDSDAPTMTETAYYQSDLKDAKKKMEEAKATAKKRNIPAIISLVIISILTFLFISTVISSALGYMGILLLCWVNFEILGILYVLFPVSIILGLVALKNKEQRYLAIISLCLNAFVIISWVLLSLINHPS